MEVFRCLERKRARAGNRLVGPVGFAGRAPSAFLDCDGCSGWCRSAWQLAGGSFGCCRRGICAASNLVPTPPGCWREPRQPHRRMALRQADHRLHNAARNGSSRGSASGHGSDRCSRLRFKHCRTAFVHLHGLHCVRDGGVGGRTGFGRDPGRVHLVGAAAAGGSLARDPLASARKRDLAGSQHRRSSRSAAPCRLRLSPGGRSALREGTAPLRAS